MPGWGQDAVTLHTVAALGYPFGDEYRQNLLFEGFVGVEPVSASIHAEDEVEVWRKFQLDEVEDGKRRGSAPSFVIINPESVLVRRMLCEGKSSVVR